MEKTVLISMPLSELQTLIIDCVTSCLKYHKLQNLSTHTLKDHFSQKEIDIEEVIFASTIKAVRLNNLAQNNPIPESSKQLVHG